METITNNRHEQILYQEQMSQWGGDKVPFDMPTVYPLHPLPTQHMDISQQIPYNSIQQLRQQLQALKKLLTQLNKESDKLNNTQRLSDNLQVLSGLKVQLEPFIDLFSNHQEYSLKLKGLLVIHEAIEKVTKQNVHQLQRLIKNRVISINTVIFKELSDLMAQMKTVKET